MATIPSVSADTASPQPVPVWDLPVRLCHWSLVILVAISWFTGREGGNAMTYHLWSGCAILALVLFRLLWGVWGSTHARFSDFVRGPRAVVGYAAGLLKGETPHWVGHNPLGGWVVVVLLLLLLFQAVSGLFANDDIMTEGPLYAWVGKATSDVLTRLHKLNIDVLLILIGLHVSAAFFYLIVKRDNLIVPMITGYKWLPRVPPDQRFASLWLALTLLALPVAGVVWLLCI